MSEKPKFTIELIKPEDQKEVYEILQEFFIKDEPNCKKMGIKNGDDAEKSVMEYIASKLGDNCSFKAVTENGEIIGVVSNAIGNKPDPNVPQKTATESATDNKWRRMCMFIDKIHENYDILKEFSNCDKFLDGKALAVNPKYRGLGIAGELIKRTIKYMEENNIQPMIRTCSSAFSARVMEKLNLKEVYSLPYADYVVNGEQVLNPDPPHKAVRIFIWDTKTQSI